MKFQMIDGKITSIDESIRTSYTWKMPDDNLNNKKRIPLMDIPMKAESFNSKKGVYIRSSIMVGVLAVAPVVADPVNGIFWDTFMKYIFPWMLDISKVYCVVKVAQAFYEENRGGKDSGSGISSLVVYGKWLLLFHLIPFFVKLVDEMGIKMMNDLG